MIEMDQEDWTSVNSSNGDDANVGTTIHYPREASYFAAACAILFVIVGIGGEFE